MGSILIIFLLSFSGFGAVQSFTVQGTSKVFDIRQNQNAWGVMAGPNATGTNQPFDSCDLEPPIVETIPPVPPETEATVRYGISPCHPQRINGDTEIIIRFVETSDFSPARQVKAIYTLQNTGTGGVGTNQPTDLATSNNTYLPNQQAQITIQWRQICNALNGSITPNGFCTEDGTDAGAYVNGDLIVDIGIWSGSGFDLISRQSVTFKIYNAHPLLGIMDYQNNTVCDVPAPAAGVPPLTGFCDIGLFPGDEGGFIFVTDENSTQSTRLVNPSGGITYNKALGGTETLQYTGLRIYFAEDPEELLPFNGIPRVDFTITSTTPLTFDGNSFGGLTNGKTYFFRAASIDSSGTISQFFSEQYCSPTNCPYQITPSQVAGVIQESSCFITTATYGSKSAYQVQTFQNFREAFLRTSFIGKKIIALYESYGPQGAVFLNNHSKYKPLVRYALFPFYLFAKTSLAYGVFSAFCLFFIVGALFLLLFKTYILRKGEQ